MLTVYNQSGRRTWHAVKIIKGKEEKSMQNYTENYLWNNKTMKGESQYGEEHSNSNAHIALSSFSWDSHFIGSGSNMMGNTLNNINTLISSFSSRILCISYFTHVRTVRTGLWEANRKLFWWPHWVSSIFWQWEPFLCGQKKVESVTGAHFTQSDSGDSKPICFGRRECFLWLGCDRSFLCLWSRHNTIPVSTFIFPLLTETSAVLSRWPFDRVLTSTSK